MKTTIYSVRFLPPPEIGPREIGLNSRRRGGIAFGPEELLVSVGDHEGIHKVDQAALAAILGDSYLRVKEVAPPATREPAASTETSEEVVSAEDATVPTPLGKPKRGGRKRK